MNADENIVKVRRKAKFVGWFVEDAASGSLLGIDILVERASDRVRGLDERVCVSVG